MRWLGMLAVVVTLAAVVLNSIWFATRGGIPFLEFVRLSIPTVGFLALFLAAVFAFGWLSVRIMTREGPGATGGEGASDVADGKGHGGSSGAPSGEKKGENPRD